LDPTPAEPKGPAFTEPH
jgi:ribonuclease HI